MVPVDLLPEALARSARIAHHTQQGQIHSALLNDDAQVSFSDLADLLEQAWHRHSLGQSSHAPRRQ
ncbi:hypothetical protein GO986_17455 [Deinococcus sp. HMF7620]|uniref:Uncharacterized protein n=1 Tax=Deinococcus arboris TaxID=2682977 RepID=A0A7C9I100_9DEIO|nr:hypothetical protein [Deinococcus arboris]MVN88528.1 hypothetical protein [Deinococcus arboris]